MRVAGVFAHGTGQCDGWALGDPSILGLTELESVKFGQCVLPAERDRVLLEPAEAEIDRVWLPVLLQHSDRALHR